MFYLLVEFNSYRQLRRLKPSLVANVEERTDEILAEAGAARVASENGQLFFEFDTLRAGEHERILDSAIRIRDFLKQHSHELAGFSVYLDATQSNSPDAAVRGLRAIALRTAIEEEAIVSEAAAIAVEAYAQLDRRGAFFVVGEKHPRPSVSATSYTEFMQRAEVVEAVLSACDPFLEANRGGCVFLHGPQGVGKGIAGFTAAMTVYGTQSDGWPFELMPMSDSMYAPFASTLTAARIELLQPWLTETESEVWRRHGDVFRSLTAPHQTKEIADCIEPEIEPAFRCLISAYVRMMESRLLPPFLICYGVHDYDQRSLELLRNVLQDLKRGTTIVILTSEKPFFPTALRDLEYEKVDVPSPSAAEWRGMAGRVTGGDDHQLPVIRGLDEGPSIFHHVVAEHAFVGKRLENRLPAGTRLLAALNDEYTKAAYAVSLVEGALSVDMLSALLSELGVTGVRTPEIVNDLRRLGYFRNTVLLSTGTPGLRESIGRAFPAVARDIRTALAHYLHSRMPTLNLDRPFYSFLLESGNPDQSLATIGTYLSRLLDSRRFTEARSLLYDSIPTFPGSTDARYRAYFHLILYVNRLRLALLSRDETTADRVFQGWRNLSSLNQGSSLHGDYLLTKAQYLAAKGSKEESLALVKKAILAYQDADDPRGVAAANGEFGSVLLGQGSIAGARDYFSISSRTAFQLSDARIALRSGILGLSTDVVMGNLTRAREQATSLRDKARSLATRESELFLDFVEARVAFELGRYIEAEELFAGCLCRAKTLGIESAGRLFVRWLARAVAYRGAAARALEILSTTPTAHESGLFRIETLILLGQYGDAASEAAASRGDEPESRFRPTETLAWDSGFANIEDRALQSQDGVIAHLIAAFEAYAAAEHGDPGGGIETLHALTRPAGEAMKEPYASLYLFLYSRILPENGGEEIEDMVTILGKAVKHLQERTSRIDDYSDKTSYLRNNYWNSLLIEKARRFNLV